MRKDKLETILDREGISRRDLFKIGFVAAGNLLLPSYGCKKGGGGGPAPDPNPTPGNNPPVITNISLGTIKEEGDRYEGSISATDLDLPNDSLTYSLIEKPAATNGNQMTIDPDKGDIVWPSAERGSHSIKARVTDSKGAFAETPRITLTVTNNFDKVSGIVSNILEETQKIDGIEVLLEEVDSNGNLISSTLPFRGTTDGSGAYAIPNAPTGKYWRVTLEDKFGRGHYHKHRAGMFFLDPNASTPNPILNFELIPNSSHPTRPFNLDFFDEVARSNSSSTRRWLRIPTVYINRGPAFQSGILPQQQEIDFIVDVFKNNVKDFNKEFSLYGNPTYIGANPPPAAFTANTIVIGTNPPPFGSTGYIRVEWDDYMNGSSSALGSNGIYPPNGDEITSAYILLRTGLTGSQQKYVNIQEAVQVFGARDDISGSLPNPSPIYPATSIFDDPQTIDFLAQKDLDLGKILYKRPVGNRSTTEAPDANPDTYRIR